MRESGTLPHLSISALYRTLIMTSEIEFHKSIIDEICNLIQDNNYRIRYGDIFHDYSGVVTIFVKSIWTDNRGYITMDFNAGTILVKGDGSHKQLIRLYDPECFDKMLALIHAYI